MRASLAASKTILNGAENLVKRGVWRTNCWMDTKACDLSCRKDGNLVWPLTCVTYSAINVFNLSFTLPY